MSNRNQCIPTPPPASTPPPDRPATSAPAPGWDESAAFRETTLQHFTQPGDAETLRRLGAMLHDMALELAPLWPIPPGYGTALQLRAAAADLRFLQGYLNHAGQDRHMSSLNPEETTLAELAARLASEVAQIVEAIERAIG
jgi:hypothetical protein